MDDSKRSKRTVCELWDPHPLGIGLNDFLHTLKTERGSTKTHARRGAQNGHAKVTESDIRMIRSSKLKNHVLAKRMHLAKNTISEIRRRQTWQHVS